MPQFKDREEYERWKQERLRESREKKLPEQGTGAPPHPPSPPSVPPGPSVPSGRPPRETGELRSIEQLFSDSWGIFKERFGTLLGLYLLPILLMLVIIGVFAGIGLLLALAVPDLRAAFIATGTLIGVLIGIIVVFWGFAGFTFAVADQGLGMQDALTKGWQRLGAFVWLYTVIGYVITGGFLLFFIPGIIFLVWFAFAQFILVNDDDRGMNAMLKSKEYVKDRWFDVFLRLLVVWLASVAISIVPFIGPVLSVCFFPFVMIFVNLVYQDLRALKGADISYPHSGGEKFKWIGLGTLGFIVVPVLIIIFAVGVMGTAIGIPCLIMKGLIDSGKGDMIFSPDQWPQKEIISPPSAGPRQEDREGEEADATGEASVVLDGTPETYRLQTGFFSETRFNDPQKASIQFQMPGGKYSNARRIELSIDAMKTGRHFADGKAITDSMFGKGPEVAVGEQTPDGYAARFQFIADGGQIFPPKNSCTITVTSPYTGSPGSVFSGEVNGCTVHSAGIDHTLSARFVMQGVPSR